MARRQSINFGEVRLVGNPTYVGSNLYQVQLRDGAGNIVRATTAIADPTAETGAGFAKGCLVTKTDAVTGTRGTYENVGTTATASMDLIGTIAAGDIGTGAVTSAKLATSAVVVTKIADGVISTLKLGTSCVTSAKIVTNAIGTRSIIASNVTSAKLASGAVVADRLASNAVIAGKFKYAAVTVAITSGATSGTAATSSNAVIIGAYPAAMTTAYTLKTVSKLSATTAKVLFKNAVATTSNSFTVMTLKAA